MCDKPLSRSEIMEIVDSKLTAEILPEVIEQHSRTIRQIKECVEEFQKSCSEFRDSVLNEIVPASKELKEFFRAHIEQTDEHLLAQHKTYLKTSRSLAELQSKVESALKTLDTLPDKVEESLNKYLGAMKGL